MGIKTCEYPTIEKALYKCNDKTDGFNTSNGWFSSLKKPYGIRLLKICGKTLLSKTMLVDPFSEKFKTQVK